MGKVNARRAQRVRFNSTRTNCQEVCVTELAIGDGWGVRDSHRFNNLAVVLNKRNNICTSGDLEKVLLYPHQRLFNAATQGFGFKAVVPVPKE